MVSALTLGAFAAPVGAAASDVAAPVVTEVMQNPNRTVDSRGEWFEVHNPATTPVDLAGWTIRDGGTDSLVIGEPLLIAPGGYVVLARNGDPALNGGVTADYVYGDSMFLFNSSDVIELVDPAGLVIDRVAWDDGASFPDPDGASMSLQGPGLDNADGAHWCAAVSVYGTGDLGTPGGANVCEPSTAAIVINEVMQNPDNVADSTGEWFELYNAGATPVSLAGWTIRDEDSDRHQIPSGADVVVPAGGFVVLARNGNPAVNGGIVADYVYGDAVALHNTSDEILLLDHLNRRVDSIAYDEGVTFPDPRGASMSLRSANLDNAIGANWCTSRVTSGPVDSSTPGLANDCTTPPPPPALIISEVMQNPAAVTDASGEWFEVYNPTKVAVDVRGWIIRDDDVDRHVVDRSLVIPAEGYAVFARNGNTATNGGVKADYVYGDTMWLINTIDELVLTNPAQVVVDRIAWDDGLSFPDSDGASMSLGDLAALNAAGGNWCVALTAYGAGDLGTPGAPNDCGVAADERNVVITEIHQNPFASGESYGEWFEVTNPETFDININGWTIRDDDSDYHKINAPGQLIVPAGGSIVIGRSLDESRNGGAGVDYSMGGSVQLVNTADEIELVDKTGRTVDRVAWSHGANGWYVRNGASMALTDITKDNNVASSWCVAGPQYGNGDLGTPGTPNVCGPITNGPGLVITEVMPNPAVVPDSVGEWFELHNPTAKAVNINGWVLRDNDYASHVIDNGGPLMVPAHGYVVIGRNSDPAQNGGVEVDYAVGAAVTLFNGVDELEVLDAGLRPIDRITWDDGKLLPYAAGASMSLRDPSLDNSVAANWCISVTEYALGDLGTPGAPNHCVVPPVGNPIDLAMDFEAKKDSVDIGDKFKYEVEIINQSEDFDTVGTWDVVLTLPPGLTLEKDKSDKRWSCNVEDFPVVRCTYDSEKPVDADKKSKKISLEVVVTDTAAMTLTATAAIDLDGAEFHDPNLNDNTMVVDTTVKPPKTKVSSLPVTVVTSP